MVLKASTIHAAITVADIEAGTYPLDPRHPQGAQVKVFDCLGRDWAYRQVVSWGYRLPKRRSGFPTARAALIAAREAAGLGGVADEACLLFGDLGRNPDDIDAETECQRCRWVSAAHPKRRDDAD